jgi:methionyl-tRNA formyltransferase
MKVLFMGTPAFAAATLDSLVKADHAIVAAVTRPDAAAGRGLRARPSAVTLLARERGITLLQPASVKGPEFLEVAASLAPDVIVVVAFGRILPQPLLDLAPHGSINCHASLLPRYRGAAPIAWAIARGERETGVTTMRMVRKLDAGDILLQRSTPIEDDDTAGRLERRLAGMAADLMVETLAGLEGGKVVATPQDESQATHAPMLDKKDGWIDWDLGARMIECRVRAFDPWPGARTRSGTGAALRIWRAGHLAEISAGGPGQVAEDRKRGGVRVTCGSGSSLLLLEVQPEGRRRMTALEAFSGRHLRDGDMLGGS